MAYEGCRVGNVFSIALSGLYESSQRSGSVVLIIPKLVAYKIQLSSCRKSKFIIHLQENDN